MPNAFVSANLEWWVRYWEQCWPQDVNVRTKCNARFLWCAQTRLGYNNFPIKMSKNARAGTLFYYHFFGQRLDLPCAKILWCGLTANKTKIKAQTKSWNQSNLRAGRMERKAPLNATMSAWLNMDGWLPIWLLNHRNISAIISDLPQITHQSSQKYHDNKMNIKLNNGDRSGKYPLRL